MKHLKTFKGFQINESIEKIEDDFFNKFTSEIDKKYFPNVKFYMDDINDLKVHQTIENFNNGVLGYDEMINRLSKYCKDTHENIHNIASKFIKNFGDYKYKFENIQ